MGSQVFDTQLFSLLRVGKLTDPYIINCLTDNRLKGRSLYHPEYSGKRIAEFWLKQKFNMANKIVIG